MLKRTLLAAVAVVLLLVVGLVALAEIRSPEQGALTDAERAKAPGRFVRLGEGLTHYELRGVADTTNPQRRLAVLVHGFSVPSYIWDSTVVALEGRGMQVLRYDLYGRGWSDRPDIPYDADSYDRQLVELLDSLAPRVPVDLMGLSMGGWVAANFTARHPERVRTLTLVDPVASPRKVPWILRVPIVGAAFFQAFAVPGMAQGQPSDFLHPERFPDWVAKYEPQMRYDGFGRALHRHLLAVSNVDLDSTYAAVGRTDRPVLLVWGRQDATTPFADSERVLRAIPGTIFVPVDSAGHLPHMERAAEVREAMSRFLDADGGDAAARVRVVTKPGTTPVPLPLP